MSAAQQDLIRNIIERWNDGDREIEPAETDPDAEVHSAMTGFTYRGFDGIRKWMAEIDEQFEDWNVSIEKMSDHEDERVLVLGRVSFRGRESGLEFDQPLGWIWKFEDGKVSEIRIFDDPEKARDALEARRR